MKPARNWLVKPARNWRVQAVRWPCGYGRPTVIAKSASAATRAVVDALAYVARGGVVYVDAPDDTTRIIERAYF